MKRVWDILNIPVTFPAWFVTALVVLVMFNGVTSLVWWQSVLAICGGAIVYMALRHWDRRHWA